MAEIVAEDKPQGTRSAASSHPPITNISRWVERFLVMSAILTLRYPEKATELLAYQALIMHSDRNYEGHQWVLYDRQFWRKVLALQNLNWSIVNSRLYSEVFTGRTKAIPRCPHCLSNDHTGTTCIKNPGRVMSRLQLVSPSQFGPSARHMPQRRSARTSTRGGTV